MIPEPRSVLPRKANEGVGQYRRRVNGCDYCCCDECCERLPWRRKLRDERLRGLRKLRGSKL